MESGMTDKNKDAVADMKFFALNPVRHNVWRGFFENPIKTLKERHIAEMLSW